MNSSVPTKSGPGRRTGAVPVPAGRKFSSPASDFAPGGSAGNATPAIAGIFQHLASVHHATLAAFARAAGMPVARCRILLLIRENDGCTQKYLTACTGVDAGSVARQLAALESEGHIRREDDGKDRRRLVVVLTATGEKLAVEVSERREVFLRSALAEVTKTEQDELIRILRRIAGNLATGR